MEHEYNDYQILSPSIMEKIAREYNTINQINNLEQYNIPQKEYDYINTEEYNYIVNNLQLVFNNLTQLKEFCSKKFYSNKEIEIKSILSKFDNLFKNINYIPEKTNTKKNTNYCEIITNSIVTISNVIEKSLDLFIIISDKSFAHIIHTESLNILKQICKLIGQCKYRTIF